MRKRLYRAGLAWLMAVGVALLLRWLYVVWPNTLTAVLTPVSASPWEWGKALYWPVLAALLLLRWMAADETGAPSGQGVVARGGAAACDDGRVLGAGGGGGEHPLDLARGADTGGSRRDFCRAGAARRSCR